MDVGAIDVSLGYLEYPIGGIMKNPESLRYTLLTIFLLSLTACSGGGGGDGSGPVSLGSSTVSGVAATGVPVSGAVTLKDANGVQLTPVTTDDNGAFSFDVTDLTAPFLFKAEWVSNSQTYRLFSSATSQGIVNINPLTNLTLWLAMNGDPSALFGSQGAPDTSHLDGATITAAQARVKDILTPLLAKYGITDFDPLRGPYIAAPDNKLDAMLDAISIDVSGNILSIKNKLDGSVIASGNVGDPITLDITRSPDSTLLADIKDITDRVKTLCSIMNLGDALTVAALEDLFVPEQYYGTSNSHTRAEDMASIVNLFGPNGSNKNGKLKTIRNVRLVSDLTASYPGRGVDRAYLLNYDFIHENGTVVHGTNCTWGKEASTGLWKFIGDPANANVGSNYGAFMQQSNITIGTGVAVELPVATITFDPGPPPQIPVIPGLP